MKYLSYVILGAILSLLLFIWQVSLDTVVFSFIAYFILIYFLERDLLRSVWTRKLSTIFILVIFLLFLILGAGFKTIIFILTFLAFLLYKWEERMLVFLSLGFFFFGALFLLSGKTSLAENLAFYGYLSLWVFVILQMIQIIKTKAHD